MANAFDDIPDAPIAQAPVPKIAKTNAFDDLTPPVKPDPPPPSIWDQTKRQVGLAGRAIAQGIAGMPMMAMDLGVSARNLGSMLSRGEMPNLADINPFATSGGHQMEYEAPSALFSRSMTEAGVPEPKTTTEKLTGFVESALTGSRMPSPQAAEQAPAGFIPPREMQAQVSSEPVRTGQKLGYVAPPATTNPTGVNKMLETVAGKTNVAQNASAQNQVITNNLAKEALGLNSDTPLTAEGLSAIRSEAAQAGYEPLKSVGAVKAPESFHEQLAATLAKYKGAERSFPGMGKTDLAEIVEKVDRPQFDAADAIDLTKILRDKASTAFRAGDNGTGQGLRDISKAVEDALDKGLQGSNQADALKNFREARALIAKSYTVEDALNPATGNVIGAKLAAALRKGEPISGPLKDAARFAAAVPKAVQEPTSSLGVNHLDIYGPMVSTLLGHTVGHGAMGTAAGLAIPAARYGTRAFLLSQMGQGNAIPSLSGAPSALPPQLLGQALRSASMPQ